MFKLIAKDGNARTGILKTAHCKIETPFFMPVATKTAVKYLDPKDLEEIGIQAVISNAFVLSLRPGINIIKKAGGIHKFMNFHNAIFTDSGGFQKIKDSFYIKSTDKGLILKSPFDGKKQLLTPKELMKIQNTLNSDIAMVLDEMPLHHQSKKEIELAVERTHKWAEECIKHHKNKKQLLFGIAQGGLHKDLREKSAKFISKLNFDGFAFGGLAIGEPEKKTYEMINSQVNHFPENKPRYLMGVGCPKQLINAVAAGADCFDSTFPTQNARHNTLFTSKGKLVIKNSRYKNDLKPIDENCNCYICKNYTRAHIRHLMKSGEPNGLRYCTYHNIYFINSLMKQIRKAIKEKIFEKFKKRFLKLYKN
ncbi:tRNA guanosine(34) transglycosylase Tgt [Candidatus Woesearchaeota archaeon]|nr:tRNA guanosine(34) transglycosylase Tgt [Candidatus Woesearchaeota archaeon]